MTASDILKEILDIFILNYDPMQSLTLNCLDRRVNEGRVALYVWLFVCIRNICLSVGMSIEMSDKETN